MTWQLVIASVAVLFTALGAQAGAFRYAVKQGERIAKLEADNETFWRVVGPRLADLIHQPRSPRRDELVTRFWADHDSLSDDELAEMIALAMIDAQDEERAAGKRVASAMVAAKGEMELNQRRKKRH